MIIMMYETLRWADTGRPKKLVDGRCVAFWARIVEERRLRNVGGLEVLESALGRSLGMNALVGAHVSRRHRVGRQA